MDVREHRPHIILIDEILLVPSLVAGKLWFCCEGMSLAESSGWLN